jgi:hypothetical protein
MATPPGEGHSPQMGWSIDGFPVYGPFGPGGALGLRFRLRLRLRLRLSLRLSLRLTSALSLSVSLSPTLSQSLALTPGRRADVA